MERARIQAGMGYPLSNIHIERWQQQFRQKIQTTATMAARLHLIALSTTAQVGQGNGPLMVRASTEIAPALWV